MSMDIKFHDGASNTLDMVAEKLVGQARQSNKDVREAIASLNANADDPALLADLQHRINKWTVVYNINSTVTQAFKNVMSSILQKV